MKTLDRYAPSGYIYVDRQLAITLFALGFDVTMHMNNVNAYHVFGGWHLSHTVNRSELETELDFKTWHELLGDVWDPETCTHRSTRPYDANVSIPYKDVCTAFNDVAWNFVIYNRGERGTYAVFCVTSLDYLLYQELRQTGMINS